MVYQIRLLRPDVIITNHDTVSGHGHHQATGRLILEAFDAAADPARFPEQLRGSDKEARVSTWQPQRLFVRTGFDGGAGKTPADEATRANTIISYDANERDPVRGTTYAEQALEALRHHATQGPWPQSFCSARIIRYRLARSAKTPRISAHAQTFLDGLQLPEKSHRSSRRRNPAIARSPIPSTSASASLCSPERRSLINTSCRKQTRKRRAFT
jgi:LmbE family N-acetylglucosaminyl deacetylase